MLYRFWYCVMSKSLLTKEDIYFKGNIIGSASITDEIINGVRDTNFKTLTKEQSKTLNEVIKETLRRVRDINEDCEVALVYDLNTYYNQYGEWLFQVRGNSSTDHIVLSNNSDVLHMLEDFSCEHIVVISHNHPNNRIISMIDFRMLIDSENTKLIVAVTNSGKISYIVKDNYNVDKFNIVRRSVVDKYKDYNGMDKNDLYLIDMLNRCEEYGVYFYKEV